MGGEEDHEHLYSRRSNLQHSCRRRTKLKMLLLVISTNLLSVYLFSGATLDVQWPERAPRIHLWDSDALRRDLNSTRARLAAARVELADLRLRCSAAGSLLDTLLSELGRRFPAAGADDPDWPDAELSGELKLVASPHKLPLGFTPNIGSDELFPALGSACRNHQEDLRAYMSYEAGGECPSDEVFAQRLMLQGCEPLPRRRCRPRSPANYVEPAPFPESMWTIPADTSITWDAYTCKNYSCLVNRGRRAKGSYDCKDCFDLLRGREKARWLSDNGGLDFGIDDVLRTRRPGTVRVGLDIGGGTGTFAARMRERNVTVVTSTMNFDGPFNSFIAARGLVPLHVSVAHRLPFADHTLDVVHSMHVLSNWIPDVMLEFALYDVYRVLRPGGLFWLDHFFCLGSQLNATYVPMLDRIGFGKLRWAAGRKLDRGIEKDEWYVSALLEKPIT